jgi:hypothetical protein
MLSTNPNLYLDQVFFQSFLHSFSSVKALILLPLEIKGLSAV